MGYEQRKKALHNVIRGWVSYFKYADARENLTAIGKWLNRRIRMCIWKSWNSQRRACTILSNAEYHNGGHINGVIRARDIGQWQVALWKSQRAIETSREQAIRHCWDTTKSIIVGKEPPYADPHVRWCERSVNESRR